MEVLFFIWRKKYPVILLKFKFFKFFLKKFLCAIRYICSKIVAFSV